MLWLQALTVILIRSCKALTDFLSILKAYQCLSLTNVERMGSRAIANATLSKVGQDSMKADLEGAKETLNAVIEIADNAQG